MKAFWGLLLVVAVAGVPACQGQAPARSKPAAVSTGLSVDDVIKMAKAGLSDDIILEQIQKRNRPFDLSTDQLIALKAAHVSDRIVVAMLDPSKAETPPAVTSEPREPLTPPVTAPPEAPQRYTAKPVKARPVFDPEAPLPSEVGVYAKKQGEWVEVPPEIVYWRTAGALKAIATAGVLQGDVNGRVAGVSSRTSFATPLELILVAPEGTVVAEYQLLHLRPKKDTREFRTVSGGVLHSQGGISKDVIHFDSKKLGSRTYEITFPSGAGPGEYGLLPPESSNGSGKIYSFRITETSGS
jgi:hypothetical protein